MTRRKRNLERSKFDRLPVIELVHNVEAKIMHQISHAYWHGNRLIGSHAPQCAAVQMIEVGMRHENEIDRG